MSRNRLIAFVFVLAFAAPAMALSPRVFVSSNGMDIGTCPISAPCRNFAYAITQVSAGGEIIALKTAGYGPVIIDKSVSIIAAPGVTAFIAAASGVDAVDIFGGAADTVTLRGLSMISTGGTIGIWFSPGLSLNVENCLITGFSQAGIQFVRSNDLTKPRLQVLNSVFRNNNQAIWTENFGPGSAGTPIPANLSFTTIASTAFYGNNVATYAGENARVIVSRSVFAGNQAAIYCSAGENFAQAETNLDRCTLSTNGVAVFSGNLSGNQITRGVARLANCQITDNDTGLAPATDGLILTRLSNGVMTNTIEGNSPDGTPTGTYAAQ